MATSSVVAGVFPWNRPDEKTLNGTGLEYDASGYRLKRDKNWKKSGNYTKTSKTYYDPSGKRHRKTEYVPNVGYDDFIGFSSGYSVKDIDKSFASKQFENDKNDIKTATCFEGHISVVEYIEEHQLLRVSFANGDVCTFYGVPWTVGGQLLHWAKTGTIAYIDKHGVKRHKLGVEFWDLVRIRGSQVNAKFPFTYDTKTQGKGIWTADESKRHTLNLPVGLLKDAFGENFVRKLGLTKDNENISVVLNEYELAKVIMELKNFNEEFLGKKGESGNSEEVSLEDLMERKGNNGYEEIINKYGGSVDMYGNRVDEYGNKISINDTYTLPNDSLGVLRQYLAEGDNYNELATYAEAIQDKAKDVADKFTNQWSSRAQEVGGWKDLIRAKGVKDKDLERLINAKELNAPEARKIKSYRDLIEISRALGKDEVSGATWMRQNLPEYYKLLQKTGKVWSRQDLIDLGNSTVPGNVPPSNARTYNAFIKAGDYLGAFNYARNIKISYIDGNGNVKRKKLIGRFDQLGTEE